MAEVEKVERIDRNTIANGSLVIDLIIFKRVEDVRPEVFVYGAYFILKNTYLT